MRGVGGDERSGRGWEGMRGVGGDVRGGRGCEWSGRG